MAASSNQKAMLVGISDYPSPIDSLPAVSNDLREMAKLLSSKDGNFTRSSVSVLNDDTATRTAILDKLNETLLNVAIKDTVFIYFAGHGTVFEDKYYFIPFDYDLANINDSCVPLTSIKSLFDQSPSKRVFLWMDFCHSGGILARGAQNDPASVIKRTLKVTNGEGKIIVSACTSSQSAYESPTLGHGFFTHALLNGLKGDAISSHGEVTAASLYDYIDHQISDPRQQPVFSGEMTGRIVLMHYSNQGGQQKRLSEKKTKAASSQKKAKGTWIMLGDDFFVADRVRNNSDGNILVELTTNTGEEQARISALRPGQYSRKQERDFAVNNEAYEIQVDDITCEHVGSKQKWSLTLSPTNKQSNLPTEMTINGIGPDEIARRRAERILLNTKPAQRERGFGGEDLVEGFLMGAIENKRFSESVINSIYKKHGHDPSWKDKARLKAVFALLKSGTVEHVIELTLRKLKNEKVKIAFKGQRSNIYSNKEPIFIEINGVCDLA